MKTYITDLPFYDIDYCKYSDWGYKKKTRFWTNIEGFIPMICKNDCENMITVPTLEGDKHPRGTLIKGKERTLHNKPIGKSIGGGSNRLERYRIPQKLIEELLLCCL